MSLIQAILLLQFNKRKKIHICHYNIANDLNTKPCGKKD
jgi:hypothetical protein